MFHHLCRFLVIPGENMSHSPIDRRGFFRSVTGGLFGGLTLLSMPESSPARYLIANAQSFAATDEDFWRLVRDQFPLRKTHIYMNNGTMGPSPYVVQEALRQREELVNTTGEYGGHDDSLPRLARFINCSDDEIAQTHNVTEGINIIAQGIKLKKGDEVIMTDHEHVGNAMPWFSRAKRDGVVIRIVPLGKDSQDVLNKINDHINKRTRGIAVPHMTCTQGQILPGKEISQLGHDKSLWVMLDGAHPCGMFPVDVKELGCDFYASCGHKWMLAPKGTGFLYVKKEMLDAVEPIMAGAGSASHWDYEKGITEWAKTAHRYDYGSQSAALAMGLSAATDFLHLLGMKNVASRGKMLANRLRQGLAKITNVEILTPAEDRSYNSIIGFRLKNMEYGKFQTWLSDTYQIRIRGVNESKLNSLRISTHIYNSPEEIDKLLEGVSKAATM
jgi:selenocysteine lyase/cysteine desulfurase